METNLLDRITELKIVSDSFVNSENKQVNYRKLVAVGVMNGNVKEVRLRGVSQDLLDLLEAFQIKTDPNFVPNQMNN